MRSPIEPAKRPPAASLAKELRAAFASAQAFDEGRKCCSNTKHARPPRARRRDRRRHARRSDDAPVLPRLLGACARGRGRRDRAARPAAGLALALAAPVLPLGNLALGLALLYGAFALGWLALSWRDSRCGLAFLAGPLLAPLGLVALVPLAVQPVRGPLRKAAHALAAVGLAALAAGLRGDELPFGQGAPEPLEVAGTDSIVVAARAVADAVPPGIALGAAALAAIAVALPYARTPWRIAGLGAGALAVTILAVPAAPATPLVVAAWLTCAVLAARESRGSWRAGRGT